MISSLIGNESTFVQFLIGMYLIYAFCMQVSTAGVVATNPAGKVHNHIISPTFIVQPPRSRHSDNGKLRGGNIKSINIGGQACKGLL
jgi:hypothetical protein